MNLAARLDRAPDDLRLLWDTAHHYPYGDNYVDPPSNFDRYEAELSDGSFALDVVFHYYRPFTDLGDGRTDFPGVRDALDDVGYGGHITTEVEIQTTDSLLHAKRNLDYWRALTAQVGWRESTHPAPVGRDIGAKVRRSERWCWTTSIRGRSHPANESGSAAFLGKLGVALPPLFPVVAG